MLFCGMFLQRCQVLAKTIPERYAIEPELAEFLRISPSSCRHIAGSPGGKRTADREPGLFPVLSTEPVFANIE